MPPKKISIFPPITSGDHYPRARMPDVVPPRFLASAGPNKGFESLTREQLRLHREPPAKTFQQCEKPSLLQGWGNSLRMFADWALGRGVASRSYETCSAESQNMADAWDVNRARQCLYRKNEGLPFEKWEPVTNFKGAFGPIELVAAGIDPTEQFVGSYRVDIFPQPDRKLRFEVTNNTSMESFLYGIGPDYEREDFRFGGNMRQTYTWTEPAEVP